MASLRYPAPESYRTSHGLTVHLWRHEQPVNNPVLLVHGFASNTLYNWVKTGWLDPLAGTGRSVIAVDLPGHGASRDVDAGAAGLRAADVLADLAEVATDTGGAVDLHGYSMGSRLSWEFAHRYPQLVSSLVMGGSPVSDEVYQVDADQARSWAAGGSEPADEATRKFITVASALPDQHLPHVVEFRLALAHDTYRPEEMVPAVPTLVVAGSKDGIAAGAEKLAELVQKTGQPAQFVEIPGRNHVNVLTARDYKSAVTGFLAR
ncbi:alpha/beta fold hydrolase [Nesterenkonia sp. MY13]|uniref:Alpha/beta fold hydrolase n=1 Tax=Nesterenkonia sedimenti TaxID=1463632 RepID=A0A7X8TKN7_9MICC|nr:alpha/beta fold hydrolase [Nesterenkonia sedimenti]NLS10557.1 alpha/beta fold hydrolase [Nesterenkonia sedimenti]